METFSFSDNCSYFLHPHYRILFIINDTSLENIPVVSNRKPRIPLYLICRNVIVLLLGKNLWKFEHSQISKLFVSEHLRTRKSAPPSHRNVFYKTKNFKLEYQISFWNCHWPGKAPPIHPSEKHFFNPTAQLFGSIILYCCKNEVTIPHYIEMCS